MRQYLFVALFVTCFFLYGCSQGGSWQKVEDLEFTVVKDEDIPEALKKLIEEKKAAPFQLSYSDKDQLYIVVGYGEQETGGYSIEVPQLYRTKENIIIDTNLLGPEGEPTGAKSTPYIVVLTEYRQEPVLYE